MEKPCIAVAAALMSLLMILPLAADEESGEDSFFTEGKNLISVYAYWNYPVSKLEYRSRGGAKTKLDYFYSGKMGLGEPGMKFYFWNIQLYYASSFSRIMSFVDTGDMLRISWEAGASYFQHRIALDFYYRKSKNYSFFQSNKIAGDPFLDERMMTYIFFQEPEIELQKFNGSFLFAFSGDFSLNAAMHHEVRQNKSSGSFVIGAAVESNEIKSKLYMIPEEHWGEFGVNESFKKLHMINSIFKAGYMYNLCYSTFFLVPELFLGGGVQFQKANFTGNDEKSIGFAPTIHAGLTTGFNNRRAVSRFRFYADWSFGMYEKFWTILTEYRIEFLIGLHY